MDLISAAAPFGFSAVVAIAVLLWVGKRVDRFDVKYGELEVFVREELIELCAKQGSLIEKQGVLIEQQGLLISECTSVLERVAKLLKEPE
jgi:hypothetical protein